MISRISLHDPFQLRTVTSLAKPGGRRRNHTTEVSVSSRRTGRQRVPPEGTHRRTRRPHSCPRAPRLHLVVTKDRVSPKRRTAYKQRPACFRRGPVPKGPAPDADRRGPTTQDATGALPGEKSTRPGVHIDHVLLPRHLPGFNTALWLGKRISCSRRYTSQCFGVKGHRSASSPSVAQEKHGPTGQSAAREGEENTVTRGASG